MDFINRLRRSFERTLSQGRGTQLLWLLALILVIILIFWCIVVWGFHDGRLQWQDLLALFLDPGCFGGPGDHDIFRLVVALLGMFLFSALLISIVSNMFENIADSFKNGHSRYHHRDHVLILGGGHQLFSMISSLLEEDCRYKKNQIVVLTVQNVDDLRTRLFSFFNGKKGRELEKRLTLYYGERDNENHLKTKDLAPNASVIYIIGEDGEVDHDSLSLRCSRSLRTICTGEGANIPCYLVLQDSASMDVYRFVKNAESGEDSRLKVDVVDANEYTAEQVLVVDHQGKGGAAYPVIDYQKIDRREDGSFEAVPGISEDSDRHVHVVVAGLTQMGRAMAFTTAHICHFPNFKGGKNRTVITFVDTDMEAKMSRFVSSMENLFRLSHYRYLSVAEDGTVRAREYAPDPGYGDFLDIEWEFLDADICSVGMSRLLKTWAADDKQALSLMFCLDRQEENTFASLHLPGIIYRKGCPIFVHQQDYGDILRNAQLTRHFGNLHIFGMASDIQDDPLYLRRSRNGQEVNFIYDQAYGAKHETAAEAWYTIPEAHKLSSIYCANALPIRARSFGMETLDLSRMNPDELRSLYETEHRRWTMSSLLLGYGALDTETRNDLARRIGSEDETVRKAAKAENKRLKGQFLHMDITPYDDLTPGEQGKDEIILKKYSLIVRNTAETTSGE